MRTIRKKLIIIFVLILVIFISYYIRNKTYKVIVKAITMEEAIKIIEQEEDYYLVKEGNASGLSYFRFAEGRLKGKGVSLMPAINSKFSIVFSSFSGGNIFLVKGHLKEGYFERESPGEYEYEIDLENWQIVSPIKRTYEYSRHFRLFAPTEYIDEYDVNHGDYRP